MHNKGSLKDTLTGTFVAAEEKIEQVLYEKWHIRLHKKAKHHIYNLRKRPDHHKDIIAFFFAFVGTCIVFIGWYAISFPEILESYEIAKKENTVVGDSSEYLQDLKSTLTNIKGGNVGIQAGE